MALFLILVKFMLLMMMNAWHMQIIAHVSLDGLTLDLSSLDLRE